MTAWRIDRSRVPDSCLVSVTMGGRGDDYATATTTSALALGNHSVTAVYASIKDLDLQCDDSVDFGVSAVSPVDGVYGGGNDTGIACKSSATVGSGIMQIPTSFMETSGGGIFQATHFTRAPFTVCGAGRISGPCGDKKFALLLDDWALHDGQEEQESPLGQDTPYFQSVQMAYSWNSAAKLHAGRLRKKAAIEVLDALKAPADCAAGSVHFHEQTAEHV